MNCSNTGMYPRFNFYSVKIGPKSYKSWYQFTLFSFPFIPEILLKSIFTIIQVFPLVFQYLLSFTCLELSEPFTSKYLVTDLVSSFRNAVSYCSNLVDVN